MTWFRKFKLGLKMYRNTKHIKTGTSFKAHLVMALKLLEIPPDIKGDVIECGCWKGGSSTNLSLICDIVGRKLKLYDSFEGLPEPDPNERCDKPDSKKWFRGTLDEVKDNIRRYGVYDRCEFYKGWFKDTLPDLTGPVVLAFLDVDYESSLHDCVLNIWPHLTEKGYMFVDDCLLMDICALFYSEKYWQKYFNRTPPGLIGAGTGLALGEFYIGPFDKLFGVQGFQQTTGAAYTRKDFSGHWTYYPDEFNGKK